MIKPFAFSDLGAFIPNEYSNPDDVLTLLVSGDYEVQTMWGDDGLVQAIICFKCYWGRCWNCFVLIAKNFIPSNLIILRLLIGSYMHERKAIRLQTESRSEPILRRFHEVLGFTLEGTKRKMMFNKDYDMWSIIREEN